MHGQESERVFGCSNRRQLTGDRGLYLLNCYTNLVIILRALSLLSCNFINTTAYHLGRYKPSYPSTKELHGCKNSWQPGSAPTCTSWPTRDEAITFFSLFVFFFFFFLINNVWARPVIRVSSPGRKATMVNLNGKYAFVSQDNFDAYLKAGGEKC